MKSAGFSLVEVVLALGIFAFCILVILGLMVTGLRSARGVADETIAVNLAESILGGWLVQDSRAVSLTIPGLITNVPPATVGGRETFYFNGDGVQTMNPAEASLLLSYSNRPAPDNRSSLIVFEFRWPANAPTNAAQTRQIVGSVPLP